MLVFFSELVIHMYRKAQWGPCRLANWRMSNDAQSGALWLGAQNAKSGRGEGRLFCQTWEEKVLVAEGNGGEAFGQKVLKQVKLLVEMS